MAGKYSVKNRALVVALTSCVSAWAVEALAQTPPPAPPASEAPAADKPNKDQVERVVVTGEKRSQDAQTAPVAVSVFNEDALRRNSVDEIDDLEFATPSLTVATAGQANMMNLRGVGKFDAGGTSTSAVATYRDGVGTVSGFFNHEPYYDIASVEVYRGPQGTYIGENAAGGAIFINTRDPVVGGEFDGYFQAGIGNYETRELQGGINIPLGDKIAVRVSGRHVVRDSFFDVFIDPAGTIPHPNRPGDIDHNSLRVSVLAQPIEQLQVLFKLDLHRLDHGGNVFGTVPGHPGSAPNISTDLYTVGNNFLGVFAEDKMARGILEVNYDFKDGSTARWISGMQYINTHIRNDDDGSAFLDNRIHIRPIFHVYTSEATYISPDEDRFRWLVGAFFRREIARFPENDGFYVYAGPGDPGLEVVNIKWNTPRQTEAVYGQVAYDLTDALEVVAGLRGQHYRSSQVAETTLFGLGFPFGTSGIRDDSYEEETINYKVALNWKATDEHYFYAFVATGNTSGGSSVLLSLPPTPDFGFTNQSSTDFEAGWKGTLMDGKLLTQFGGFYTKIEDYQATFAELVSVGPPLVTRTTFQNIKDDTIVYGIELQAQAKFDDLGIDFNLAWIHSELGQAVVNDITTGTLLSTGGKQVPWTPEYTVNVGVQYDFHVWEDATLTPRITYSWIDEQTVTATDRVIAGIPIDRIFAHDVVNVQLTLETGTWLFQMYMTNALEEEYIQAHSGDTIPDPDAYANEPMRYGVRVTKNFSL